MDLIKALELYVLNHPGAYSIVDSYDTLVWLDDPENPPSYEELEEIYNEYLRKLDRVKYKELRMKEYPSISEQLDLIYHGGIEAWKEVILAIKQKYPKPE